jgi:hypothetical protein
MGERHAFSLPLHFDCHFRCELRLVSGKPSQGRIGAGADRTSATNRQGSAPNVARDEQPADGSRGEQQPESASPRGQNARARAGGPPALNIDTSCETAGMGSVVLGRDEKACLGDEITAQDTLRQNWSKYAAADRRDCIGMVTTGGPPSYVEPLSCVEMLRDARDIYNTDAQEADDNRDEENRR